jgi:hypothetical protein
MSVGRVCSRYMATILPEGTVEEAASLMARLGVDTLVVVGGDGQAAGIVTDRDLVVRCLARGGFPRETFVLEIMTSPVPASFDLDFPEDRQNGTHGFDTPRIVRGAEYETLSGLLALDDVLALVDRELNREEGYGRRDAVGVENGQAQEREGELWAQPRSERERTERTERRRRGRDTHTQVLSHPPS